MFSQMKVTQKDSRNFINMTDDDSLISNLSEAIFFEPFHGSKEAERCGILVAPIMHHGGEKSLVIVDEIKEKLSKIPLDELRKKVADCIVTRKPLATIIE